MKSIQMSLIRRCLLYLILAAVSTTSDNSQPGGLLVSASGTEKAFFTTPQMAPNVTHRQSVCHRYHKFRNGTVELKDALAGMQLNLLMSAYTDGYFNYDPEAGIHPENPGMAGVLMDELARRASFTWRDSFGVSGAPEGNQTWTDLLVWGTEVYDMNIDWWAQNVDRMNMGVAFLEEWYDSSIILIHKKPVQTVSKDINFWNWLRPYDARVWLVTVATIILSGLVYQWLEHLAGERNDRSVWEWFMENCYLSVLNFTQTYEYQPRTAEARLFGVSMAIWALVMTATYTANLASLLVDKQTDTLIVTSIEEAVIAGAPICTFEGTNSDTFIKQNMPTAVRVEKKNLEEVYQGLHDGQCVLAAEVVASWNELKSIRKYNPTCDLERITANVWSNKAGFTTKADAGHLCSGLIRDVVNLHMSDMIADGFLEDAWEREHKYSLDIDCDAYRPELDIGLPATAPPTSAPPTSAPLTRTRRRLGPAGGGSSEEYDLKKMNRVLKAGGGATGGAVAAAAANGDSDASKLTLEQMIGTFAFHWVLMAIAVFIGYFKQYYGMYGKKPVAKLTRSITKRLTTFSERNATNSETAKHADTKEQANNGSSPPTADHSSSPREGGERAEGYFDQESGLIDNYFCTDSGTEVHGQLKVMRDSQIRLQENQTQMLEEQRGLKEQIQTLVSLVHLQQTQLQSREPPLAQTT